MRYFGIPVEGPAEVFCDNMSVVKNSSIPTLVLNKRHNAICYHRFREDQAAGILLFGWILEEFNLADLFTKSTMPGNTNVGILEFFTTDMLSQNTSAGPSTGIPKYLNLYLRS